MKLQTILWALPITATFACGGKVFLDDDKNASGSGGSSGSASGGATAASLSPVATLSTVCGPLPEMVAAVPAGFARIDALAASDQFVTFAASESAPAGAHGNFARSLTSSSVHLVPIPLRAADAWGAPHPRLPEGGSAIALRGGILYFTFDNTEPPNTASANFVYARNLATDLSLPGGRVVEFRAAGPITQIGASEDGFLFGINRKPPNVSPAWVMSAAQGGGGHSFDHEGTELSDLSVFNGGFASVTKDGEQIYLGLQGMAQTIVAHRSTGCFRAKHVRGRKDATGSISLFVHRQSTCGDTPGDEIVRDACVTDMTGVRSCPAADATVLLTADANMRYGAFDIRNDGSIVASQVGGTGLRPIGQVVRKQGEMFEVIGGEGVTGNVDDITALAVHGNCTYWAEQGAAGTRIMRVGR